MASTETNTPTQTAQPMQTDTIPERGPEQPAAATAVAAAPATATPAANIEGASPPAKKPKSEGGVEERSGVKEQQPDDFKKLQVRPYLEKTVVPLLMQGMQQLVRDRPDDPVDALADYLRSNNPKRKPTQPGSTAP